MSEKKETVIGLNVSHPREGGYGLWKDPTSRLERSFRIEAVSGEKMTVCYNDDNSVEIVPWGGFICGRFYICDSYLWEGKGLPEGWYPRAGNLIKIPLDKTLFRGDTASGTFR